MGTIPDHHYGVNLKPGTTTQVGCVWHLIEGQHEPVDVVYYWGGTSLCLNHLKSHAKAYPLLATTPTPTSTGPND